MIEKLLKLEIYSSVKEYHILIFLSLSLVFFSTHPLSSLFLVGSLSPLSCLYSNKIIFRSRRCFKLRLSVKKIPTCV